MGSVVSKIKACPDMTLLEIIDEFELKISESALRFANSPICPGIMRFIPGMGILAH